MVCSIIRVIQTVKVSDFEMQHAIEVLLHRIAWVEAVFSLLGHRLRTRNRAPEVNGTWIVVIWYLYSHMDLWKGEEVPSMSMLWVPNRIQPLSLIDILAELISMNQSINRVPASPICMQNTTSYLISFLQYSYPLLFSPNNRFSVFQSQNLFCDPFSTYLSNLLISKTKITISKHFSWNKRKSG
jgi:hypothetical protein